MSPATLPKCLSNRLQQLPLGDDPWPMLIRTLGFNVGLRRLWLRGGGDRKHGYGCCCRDHPPSDNWVTIAR
ncbi:MAG TPA: hypothetical protein DIT38_09515 [Burkholderiales bacterium]|nr:hypothetical protein [Burkholderiales bacterium]